MKVTRVYGMSEISPNLVVIYEDSKFMFSLGLSCIFQTEFFGFICPSRDGICFEGELFLRA